MPIRPGNNGQLRGAIFEALVHHWAVTAGYIPVGFPNAGHPPGADPQLFRLNGLPMVHGLGEGHNADVLLEYPIRLALTPKLRLLIECKGYGSRVGLPVIRGALGLREDVNAFRQLSDVELAERRLTRRPARTPAQFPHYHVAVASLFGFSSAAQSFAAAHHIELLDYSGLPILGGLAEAVSNLRVERFDLDGPEVDDEELVPIEPEVEESSLAAIAANGLMAALRDGRFERVLEGFRRAELLTPSDGLSDLEAIFETANRVRGVYSATLPNGLHFQMLGSQVLSTNLVRLLGNGLEGALRFEIYYNRQETRTWSLHFGNVELQFSLPKVLLNAWRRGGEQGIDALRMKQGYFRRIDIVGPFSSAEQGRPLIRHIVGQLDEEFLSRALAAAGVRDAQI